MSSHAMLCTDELFLNHDLLIDLYFFNPVPLFDIPYIRQEIARAGLFFSLHCHTFQTPLFTCSKAVRS